MPAVPALRRVITLNKGVRWTPAQLGASLYDYWDAEQADTLSLSGSAVTAWRSAKNGYSAAQGTGAARPTYSATSFNSRPGVTFDGSDDELTYAGVGVFPTGSVSSEIWALVNQTALGSSAGVRAIFNYGGNAAAAWRRLNRTTDGSLVNRATTQMGTGAAGPAAQNDNVDFSGRNVARSQIKANLQTDVNGIAGAVNATGNPATGTTRTRIGARNDDTPNSFFQGVVSFVAVTAPLTTNQAVQMLAYLKQRGGIS